MKAIGIRNLIIVVNALVAGVAFAQAQFNNLKVFSKKDGLPTNHVVDVTQDSKGLIWAATNGGVANFDGINWRIIPTPDLIPIGNDVRIRPLKNGGLIIAGTNTRSEYGAYYYDSKKWIGLEMASPKEILKRPWAIIDHNSNFYLKYIVGNTLYTYNSENSTTTSKQLPETILHSINKLLVYHEELYLLTEHGIFVERKDNLQPFHENIFGEWNVVDFKFQSDSSGYLLSGSALSYWDGMMINPLFIQPQEKNPKFQHLNIVSRDVLFFRSEKNFYRYHISSNNLQAFNFNDPDLNPTNAKIFFDWENTLWITGYRALYHIFGLGFTALTKEHGMVENEVSLILEFKPNQFLVGGNTGYSIIENNQILLTESFSESYPNINSRLMNYASVLKRGKKTIYLAGNDLGLGILQPDNKIQWNKLKGESITLVFHANDTIWAGDFHGKLYAFHNGQFKFIRSINIYPRNAYVLNDGSIVICTAEGLYVMRGNTITLASSNSVLLKQTYCLWMTDTAYYVGTGRGVGQWIGDKIIPSTINGYTIEEHVFTALRVSPNELWLGTDNGLLKIKDSILVRYNEQNGLTGSELNRGALLLGSDGNILAGTNKGLNIFNAAVNETMRPKNNPEILWLKNMDSTFVNPWNHLEFKADQNNITIGLRAITFLGEPVSFRYRMIGLENDWQLLKSVDLREVSYKNLPPGEFHFELQSKVGNEPWSKSVSSPYFTIQTPFYYTWWFYAICLGAAGSIGFIISRIVNQISKTQELKELVESKIKEIKDKEAKLQLALENAKMGVWSFNFINKTFEYTEHVLDILNIKNEHALSYQSFLDSVLAEDKVRVFNEIASAIKTKSDYNIEARVVLQDGSVKWFHGLGRCSYDKDGKPMTISGTLHDITVRKEFEVEQKKLIHELELKNTELDRFAYSTSHDLSAPLKSILGLVNLAKKDIVPSDKDNYLNLIERSAKKMDEFIKEIIQYTRNARTTIQREKLNVENLIKETIQSLQYSDEHAGVQVTVQIKDGVFETINDAERIKIILNNLLSNAFKFKRQQEGVPHTINISVDLTNNNFWLQVADNGIGIDEKYLNSIFRMFYRANDRKSGSGLGLYIAMEAAKKINCTIEVQSILGQGSSFTVMKEHH